MLLLYRCEEEHCLKEMISVCVCVCLWVRRLILVHTEDGLRMCQCDSVLMMLIILIVYIPS